MDCGGERVQYVVSSGEKRLVRARGLSPQKVSQFSFISLGLKGQWFLRDTDGTFSSSGLVEFVVVVFFFTLFFSCLLFFFSHSLSGATSSQEGWINRLQRGGGLRRAYFGTEGEFILFHC